MNACVVVGIESRNALDTCNGTQNLSATEVFEDLFMFTLIIIFLVDFIYGYCKYCDQKKQYLFFKMFVPIQKSENNASNSITYFIFSLILLSLIFY